MQLRAVATDVDRTLTDDALVLDLDAIRTIRLLEGAGIPVVLCSGRDVIALGALAHYLGTSGVIVAEDGAILGRFGPAHYSTRLLAKPERVHEALAALEEAFGVDVQVVPVPSRLASFVLARALDVAAVGNAGPDVKAKATYACARPHGQGFIEAVRRAIDLFRPDLSGLPWPEPVPTPEATTEATAAEAGK